MPPRRTIITTYDELERKKVIADTNGFWATYAYVGPNRVTRRDYSNGTRLSYTYDGISGVPSMPGDFGVKQVVRTLHTRISDGSVLDDRLYAWDRMGNKTRNDDLRAGGPEWHRDYRYDSVYRLVHSVWNSPTGLVQNVQYNLDGVGNRVSVSGGSNPGNYTMNATLPQPADFQVNQYTTTAFDNRSYDLNGNLGATDAGLPGQRTFTYDYRNRLVGFTDAETGVRASYAYDAVRRRIRKTVFTPPINAAENNTTFLYDGWQCIAEVRPAADFGLRGTTFVYGNYIDEVLHSEKTDHVFYHQDQLYSVVLRTDDSAAPVDLQDYSDYGSLLYPSASSYRYTGRRFDTETGFLYYRTRYYDHYAGCFIKPDLLGTWGAQLNRGNSVAYVASNPLRWTDPFGFDVWLEGPSPHQESGEPWGHQSICVGDPKGITTVRATVHCAILKRGTHFERNAGKEWFTWIHTAEDQLRTG